MSNQALTNRDISNLMGNVLSSFRIRHIPSGEVWRSSYAGPRTDHYDSTPMTPEDAAAYQRAFGSRQYDWIGEDCEMEVAPGVWAACGIPPFRHGGIIGTARPGSTFNNHSNVRPPAGWKRDGGHYCVYPINGTGGTTNATTLPSARNRKVSDLANQRAVQMNARGAMSRAAAQEALIKNGATEPPQEMPNVSVNYNIRVVTSGTVNIRSEPSTERGSLTVVGTARNGDSFDIDREQQGRDGNVESAKWLRIRGGKFNGRWVIARLTVRTAVPPATPQPTPGTWSVQCVAARESAYIDEQIARIRGMGYPDAFRTKSVNGWYQARVPAGTETQARQLTPVLRSKGFKEAFPVLNE
jgi:hypothetical protein